MTGTHRTAVMNFRRPPRTKLDIAFCDIKFSNYSKTMGSKYNDTSFILSFRAVRGISAVLGDFNFGDVRLSAFGLGTSHGSE
jgi:hypothetical protein